MMTSAEPVMGSLMPHVVQQSVQQIHRQQRAVHKQDPHVDKKLWRASLAFETMFVQQLLSAMHKTVPSSGFIQKGFAEDVQSSMLNQALAKSIGGQGQLGIAKNIYRQVSQATQAPANHTDKMKKE